MHKGCTLCNSLLKWKAIPFTQSIYRTQIKCVYWCGMYWLRRNRINGECEFTANWSSWLLLPSHSRFSLIISFVGWCCCVIFVTLWLRAVNLDETKRNRKLARCNRVEHVTQCCYSVASLSQSNIFAWAALSSANDNFVRKSCIHLCVWVEWAEKKPPCTLLCEHQHCIHLVLLNTCAVAIKCRRRFCVDLMNTSDVNNR